VNDRIHSGLDSAATFVAHDDQSLTVQVLDGVFQLTSGMS
jgi:hypothetical protein